MQRTRPRTPCGAQRTSAIACLCALSAAGLVPAGVQAQDSAGPELTAGAVFAMSNARAGNTVVAYYRNADGTIDEAGRFETGGSGSGSFEDTDNGIVLATLEGEIAPNNLVEPSEGVQQYLLVTNAGSNDISVFAVRGGGLERTDLEPSNGEKPVSITVNDGLVYVLNSGETDDRLFDDNGMVIPNCTTGMLPSITGFRLDAEGDLSPIPDSTRALSGEATSGCAQVSFDPSGDTVVVTERLARPPELDQQTSMRDERLDDEGVILTYAVDDDGTLQSGQLFDSTGQGPFGFTFTKGGQLLVTEQFDGPAGVRRGAASSYLLDGDGESMGEDREFLRSSPAIRNGGTDTCWIVATDNGQLAFATSFFGNGRISSYAVDDIGLVRIVQRVATGALAREDDVEMGASDLSLDRDSNYLYQLNSINGTVSAFEITPIDGSLDLIDMETPFPQPMFGPGMGEAAPIGLSAS